VNKKAKGARAERRTIALLAERTSAAPLLPTDQQKDRNQQGCADPKDDPADDGSPRILGSEKAVGGPHGEHRQGEHYSHGQHTGGEADGLRIEVVQSRTVWPVRSGGAR